MNNNDIEKLQRKINDFKVSRDINKKELEKVEDILIKAGVDINNPEKTIKNLKNKLKELEEKEEEEEEKAEDLLEEMED